MRLLESRVAIVTGAGHGIGRAEALELAAHGARVVVNDLGGTVDGVGAGDPRVADAVVARIRQRGGQAVANAADIATWAGARNVVEQAIGEFGALDIVVNNAGIMRCGAFVDMTEDDWDALMQVHMKGTFAMMNHAARYWKAESDAGRRRAAAIVNTTSGAGLPGGSRVLGMECYGAAKAGIASLTVGTAPELSTYGVRINAVAPSGATRMLAFGVRGERNYAEPDASSGFDPTDPANNAPLVAWLASDNARHVTGQVFGIRGNEIVHYQPWRAGARATTVGRWEADRIGDALKAYVFDGAAMPPETGARA